MDVRKLFCAQDKVCAVLVFIFLWSAVCCFSQPFFVAALFFIVLYNKLLSNTFEYKIYGHFAAWNLILVLVWMKEGFQPAWLFN